MVGAHARQKDFRVACHLPAGPRDRIASGKRSLGLVPSGRLVQGGIEHAGTLAGAQRRARRRQTVVLINRHQASSAVAARHHELDQMFA